MSLPSINLRQPNTTTFPQISSRGKTTTFANMPEASIEDIEDFETKSTKPSSKKLSSLPGIKGAFTEGFEKNKKDTQELSDLAKQFDRASLNATIAQARQQVEDRATAAASNIMKRNTNTNTNVLPPLKKSRYNLGGKRRTRKNRRTRKSKKNRRRSTRRNKK